MPSRQPAGRRRYKDLSSLAWAASMKPMVCAMPACQGAGQVICGVWSGMIDTIEFVFRQDGEDANHIHVALIDECLAVVWHFSHHVAQMDVGDFSLPAVAVDGVVDVAFGHLGQRSHA